MFGSPDYYRRRRCTWYAETASELKRLRSKSFKLTKTKGLTFHRIIYVCLSGVCSVHFFLVLKAKYIVCGNNVLSLLCEQEKSDHHCYYGRAAHIRLLAGLGHASPGKRFRKQVSAWLEDDILVLLVLVAWTHRCCNSQECTGFL